jgi:activator of HSP90 ATPase
MNQIEKHYEIKAPVSAVWEALVSSAEIENWGGGPAKMEAKPGTDFSLWGGDIFGKNLVVVPEKKLIQEWYGGKWEKPSKAEFTLKESDGGTVLDFVQNEVPKEEEKEIDTGWDDYYLGAIKKYLEK